ncbi:MAG: phosphoribosylformylglycinamidine cyclo-ligase [Pseudomonadota bacterium]
MSKAPTNGPGRSLTYRDAGVDIDAGNALIERIAPAAARTRRPEILSDVGGFAALARLPEKYEEPVLVTGTDGVGTKLKLAIDHDAHDTVGQDLVAMCVNDVLVTGAEPFLFLDYYATAALEVDVAERVIKGIAAACELAGCALAGGETAEMPGFYSRGDYDLAGFCIGVAERARIVDGKRIRAGDVLLGLPSSGAHSNGYSLIRRVLEQQALSANDPLVEQLLAPTRIYARSILALQDAVTINGMAHITGGGLPENLPRMFPRDSGLAAELDYASWQRPELFSWLQQAGNIEEAELLRTFNCGIGFVICVRAEDADAATAALKAAGEAPVHIGEVVPV